MERIIECVPNFSEGRDMNIINRITAEIEHVDGVNMLDVDPGKDTNRTVVTFAGQPEPVMRAAVAAVKKAQEFIDMRKHRGAHPRMGATDVCPLVPVSNISMEECAELAAELGRRINEATGIPVYLYGEAAQRSERYNLPDIRKGEYEALEEKLKDPDFKPDHGEAVFLPESGVTAVGARHFMLAYNINLNTRNVRAAKDIALTIRSKGRAKRDKDRKIIRDKNGKMLRVPGRLKFCQAGGWYIDEYGYAQVTMNLHRIDVTGLHTAFDTVCEEAAKRGLRVTGSELIGLVPLKAMLDAGMHYLRKQDASTACPEKDIIHTAVHSLGLNETSPFDPDKRIVEYALREETGDLKHLTLQDFTDLLSSNAPAPGGGSIAALNASLAAALSAMVANLTFENKKYAQVKTEMQEKGMEAQSLKVRAMALIDEDTQAFDKWMQAMRMPKKREEDKIERNTAIQKAVRGAIDVPYSTLSLCADILSYAEYVMRSGNENCLSDAAVAVRQVQAAAWSAYYNVLINLPSLEDEEERKKIAESAKAALEKADAQCTALGKEAEEVLSDALR